MLSWSKQSARAVRMDMYRMGCTCGTSFWAGFCPCIILSFRVDVFICYYSRGRCSYTRTFIGIYVLLTPRRPPVF